jgi:hypothetical protein
MALERDTYTGPFALEPPQAEQAQTCRRVVTVAWKALGVGPAGASVSADLGGSSKYSSEILED